MLWWVLTTFFSGRRQYRTMFDGGEFSDLQVLELQKPGMQMRPSSP